VYGGGESRGEGGSRGIWVWGLKFNPTKGDVNGRRLMDNQLFPSNARAGSGFPPEKTCARD